MSERGLFGQDDDLPPVVAEPVRRDPDISIRRDRPARMSEPQKLARTFGGPDLGAVKIPAILVAVMVVLVAAVVFAGFAAHAAEHAIMLGWRLGG
jgi:hypothetical protein